MKRHCFYTNTRHLRHTKRFFGMANIKPEITITDLQGGPRRSGHRTVALCMTQKDFQKATCKVRIEQWYKLHLTGTSPETYARLVGRNDHFEEAGPY